MIVNLHICQAYLTSGQTHKSGRLKRVNGVNTKKRGKRRAAPVRDRGAPGAYKQKRNQAQRAWFPWGSELDV